MADNPTYCPVHEDVKKTLAKMEDIQKDRPCGVNTQRIASLEKNEERIMDDNKDQWTAINQVRRLVYMGAGVAGVLAFLGSMLGVILKK